MCAGWERRGNGNDILRKEGMTSWIKIEDPPIFTDQEDKREERIVHRLMNELITK